MFLVLVAAVALIHQGNLNCQAQENVLDLSQLNSISIGSNSSVASDLLDPSFWGEVNAATKQTFLQLAPQTVIGFLNSSQDWRDWLENNSANPPSWLHDGFIDQVNSGAFQLSSAALGSKNTEQAASTIQSFAQAASSYTLATVDYLSLNGLTSLRTYTDTGSISEATCVSFPAQLAQLYNDSVDSSIPSELRAKYLGQAIAITELTVLVSGSDGLTAKFSDALNKVGLAASWDTIKPFLSEIGTRVSTRAGFLAFSLAAKLAQRFPQNAVWVTGLTADRVEWMVEGLKQEGFTNDAVEQKISGLIQAAGDATNPDDVAIDADVIRYQAGAGLSVKIGSQDRIYEYTDGQTMEVIQASFLKKVVPGFQIGQDTVLAVDYVEKAVTVYHEYTGGNNWSPTARSDVAQEGDIVTLKMQVLTSDSFVANLPKVSLVNYVGKNWVSERTDIGSFALNENDLGMTLTQDPPLDDVPEFTLHGIVDEKLSFIRGDVVLQFAVQDIFGNMREMRIYHDGYSQPSFGIQAGSPFLPVALLSYDGTRFRVVYEAGDRLGFNVATIYESNPLPLYSFGSVDYTDLLVTTAGASNAFQISQVTFTRPLEKAMFDSGAPYDLARLGVEIAYKVGTENLGLKDLVINEPSQIGPDLITKDDSVVMQARFLKITSLYTQQQLQDALQQNLQDMNGALKKDFKANPAHTGVIVLSYTDSSDIIKAIVLEIQRPP